MKSRTELTQARLRELLRYDWRTGLFVWISVKPQKAHLLGSVAGCTGYQGYVSIRVDGVALQAHRLAFLYMSGGWPSADVDHRNGVRSDNRWRNLRACTRGENMQNVRLQKNNTSGHMGVTWNRERRKWVAQIGHESKYTNLGGFDSFDSARSAYLSAKSDLHKFQPTPRP